MNRISQSLVIFPKQIVFSVGGREAVADCNGKEKLFRAPYLDMAELYEFHEPDEFHYVPLVEKYAKEGPEYRNFGVWGLQSFLGLSIYLNVPLEEARANLAILPIINPADILGMGYVLVQGSRKIYGCIESIDADHSRIIPCVKNEKGEFEKAYEEFDKEKFLLEHAPELLSQ